MNTMRRTGGTGTLLPRHGVSCASETVSGSVARQSRNSRSMRRSSEIHRFYPDLSGCQVCVIGSGDNYAAFALAGLGARVTSVDISERQLEVAEGRARTVGLAIHFVRADAADLATLRQGQYDLVVSTNGFFVWISEPAAVFRAGGRCSSRAECTYSTTCTRFRDCGRTRLARS
jgi:SAM-dependent methyltransferase